MLRLKLAILAVALTEVVAVALVYLLPAAKFIASVHGSWHITVHNGFVCCDTSWKRSTTEAEFLQWSLEKATVPHQGARPTLPPVPTSQTTLQLCPVLMIVLFAANVPGYIFGSRALALARIKRRRAKNLCVMCGYNLSHLTSNTCPECGGDLP
jgi:hypothetical protein